jgi:hypothetical protein
LFWCCLVRCSMLLLLLLWSFFVAILLFDPLFWFFHHLLSLVNAFCISHGQSILLLIYMWGVSKCSKAPLYPLRSVVSFPAASKSEPGWWYSFDRESERLLNCMLLLQANPSSSQSNAKSTGRHQQWTK